MIQKILFATDLSFFGSYLLRHAVQLAVKESAKITIVHAVEPLSVFADAVIDAYVAPEVVPHIKSQGMPALMDAIRDQVLESIKIELADANFNGDYIEDIVIDRGHPSDIILKTAFKCKSDIILMGSSGHDEGRRHMLGSVTTKVLQLSNLPVLMIPVNKDRAVEPANLQSGVG